MKKNINTNQNKFQSSIYYFEQDKLKQRPKWNVPKQIELINTKNNEFCC
jgi:hypothetical protein